MQQPAAVDAQADVGEAREASILDLGQTGILQHLGEGLDILGNEEVVVVLRIDEVVSRHEPDLAPVGTLQHKDELATEVIVAYRPHLLPVFRPALDRTEEVVTRIVNAIDAMKTLIFFAGVFNRQEILPSGPAAVAFICKKPANRIGNLATGLCFEPRQSVVRKGRTAIVPLHHKTSRDAA